MANIQHWLEQIRRAVYGREVRSSIADAIEAINKEQSHLDGAFDQLIINAGNSNAEIVDARVKADGTQFNTLGERLAKSDEQFDELNKEVIEARTDKYGVDHGRLKARLDTIDEQLDTKAYKTYITPYEFGAVKNSESTKAFKDMFLYAKNNNLPIMLPKDGFIISETLELFSGLTLYGENGLNSIDSGCHIKYEGNDYLFNSDVTKTNIKFSNICVLGRGSKNNYTNSLMKLSCQRAVIEHCTFMYFDKVIDLDCKNNSVVENIIINNIIQFCNVCIDNNSTNTHAYTDGIIDGNYLATYDVAGIRGFYAEWKITNNQIYTNSANYTADIEFGGYANYITNNNFGGFTRGIVYDNVKYPTNLYENIISDNMFFSPPNGDNDIFYITINTNTSAKLLISNNIFGCERFKDTGNGKKYAIYCTGNGFQTSHLINNQGYSAANIGGASGSRVSDLYIVGYSDGIYKIGTGLIGETLSIGKLEISSSNGVPQTDSNNAIGKLITDVTSGNLYISRGQYGNHRFITTTSSGNLSNIEMTSSNKIRYTTDISTEYPIGDLIINVNTGDIYISKGAYGNKKVLTEN